MTVDVSTAEMSELAFIAFYAGGISATLDARRSIPS